MPSTRGPHQSDRPCEDARVAPGRRRGVEPMSGPPDRPEGFKGAVDRHIPTVQDALVRRLSGVQKEMTRETLKLPRPALRSLAAILVGVAEDLHCGIGLWRSLERANREFF